MKNKIQKRTCPICSRVFDALPGEVFCRTSCRRKAALIKKYRKVYAIGKV